MIVKDEAVEANETMVDQVVQEKKVRRRSRKARAFAGSNETVSEPAPLTEMTNASVNEAKENTPDHAQDGTAKRRRTRRRMRGSNKERLVAGSHEAGD